MHLRRFMKATRSVMERSVLEMHEAQELMPSKSDNLWRSKLQQKWSWSNLLQVQSNHLKEIHDENICKLFESFQNGESSLAEYLASVRHQTGLRLARPGLLTRLSSYNLVPYDTNWVVTGSTYVSLLVTRLKFKYAGPYNIAVDFMGSWFNGSWSSGKLIYWELI